MKKPFGRKIWGIFVLKFFGLIPAKMFWWEKFYIGLTILGQFSKIQSPNFENCTGKGSIIWQILQTFTG
jgi:hypothetical protein